MHEQDLVLGIDIGGTNTALGFVERSGSLTQYDVMPTRPADSAGAFVAALHRRTEALRAEIPFPHRLVGIGIGAPNAHPVRGTLEQPVNLDWGATVDLTALVRKYYDLPVELTNDAKAAAAGEMLFGGARGMKHFIVVTLGTGLGCGIVADGRILTGASGFAGELGHMTVDPNGRECRCGKRGCLETYASAGGLVRTVLALLAKRCDPSPLHSLAADAITSQKVFAFAQAGDAVSLCAFDRTARILGMKLADAVACLSPEAVFLAGGLAAAGDLLLAPAQRYMNDYLFRAYRGTVRLLPSALKPGEGAVLGAAALIWSRLAAQDPPERREGAA